MEITLMQCLLIGIWSAICMTGMLMGTFLTRCLVMSAGVGVILGDIPAGLAMGAAGELAFLGYGVSQGGSVPPNPMGPGIVGAIMVIAMKETGIDTEAALALSFPFAVGIQFLITGVFTGTTLLLEPARAAVEAMNFKRFMFLSNSTIFIFMVLGFFVGFGAAFSSEGLQHLLSKIPKWLMLGFATAGKMLPAIGFAMILNVMMKKKWIPCLIVGYLGAAYFKLPIMGVTLAGSVLALMFYFGGGKEKWEEETTKNETSGKEPEKVADGIQKNNPTHPAALLTTRDYRKVTFRAYFLQNGYNYGNYEGLGYVNVMYPALKKLFPEKEKLRRVIRDNLGFFSTNPNFVPIITNFHLVMLEEGREGEETYRLKTALMGPLGGIGDSLIQFCIAPIIATLGATLAMEGMMSGPVLFLLLMNGILLIIKLVSGSLGIRLGREITGMVEGRIQRISEAAGMLGVTVIAGLTVSFVNITTPLTMGSSGGAGAEIQQMLDMVAPKLLPVAFTAFVCFLIRKKWNMYRLVLLTVILGTLLYAAGILN